MKKKVFNLILSEVDKIKLMIETLQSITNKRFKEAKGQLRYGQCMFNTLYEINEELADELRGDVTDPFYNDKKCEEFLKEIIIRLVDKV